jgi:hypothetical protein
MLALADTRKRHRALLLAQRQVNHRRDGETAFRGESHMYGEPLFSTSFVKYKYMSDLVKYPYRNLGHSLNCQRAFSQPPTAV